MAFSPASPSYATSPSYQTSPYASASSPPQYPIFVPDPPSQLSLVDMRAQILANASILLPLLDDATITRDGLEITTARFIPRASNANQYKYYAMLVRRPQRWHPGHIGQNGRPQQPPPGSMKLAVLVKGKPLDSEMAALAWMLNAMEEKMHELAGNRQAVTEESCALM